MFYGTQHGSRRNFNQVLLGNVMGAFDVCTLLCLVTRSTLWTLWHQDGIIIVLVFIYSSKFQHTITHSGAKEIWLQWHFTAKSSFACFNLLLFIFSYHNVFVSTFKELTGMLMASHIKTTPSLNSQSFLIWNPFYTSLWSRKTPPKRTVQIKIHVRLPHSQMEVFK